MWVLAGPIKCNWPSVTSWSVFQYPVTYLSLSANSPLILSQWQHELRHHPDKRYTKYILQGTEEGFKIGFSDSKILQPSTSNLSTPNPVITDYLVKEVFLNRMWKYPLNAAPPGIHQSVGTIPKKNKPGKYRLIMDLSSPKNFSVNDGIDSALSSLSYASIDHLSSLILSLGRGAMLVKADIKEAY